MSETTCAPMHLRWPNESCLTGATRKRTPYDDLTLGQFVVGFLKNAMDTTNPQLSRAMLNELVETMKLSENLSWPIARGAFVVAMHRIEEESVNWSDTRFLAENGLTFSQTAVFSGSVTMSPKVQPTQVGPRWQSGNTLASHLCVRGSIPVMAVSGKAGSCLPLVGSLQYRTLANYMYWFPLPFQLPVVI